MNYEGLEGTRFNLVHPDGEVRVAVIAGCDPDIGYTIQDAATGEYLICSNGPSSQLVRGIGLHEQAEWVGRYMADFDFVARQIAEWGVYTTAMDYRVVEEIWGGEVITDYVSAETCAFAQ